MRTFSAFAEGGMVKIGAGKRARVKPGARMIGQGGKNERDTVETTILKAGELMGGG